MTLLAAKGVLAGSGTVQLGFSPQAVLLWWTTQDEFGVADGCEGGIGMWAGGAGYAATWSSRSDSERTRTRRWTDTVTLAGEPGRLTHYLALGGLQEAASGWLDERVELGFRPDLVLVSPAPAGETGLVAAFGAAAESGQAAASYVSPDGLEQPAVVGVQRSDAAIRLESSGFSVDGELEGPYLALAGLRCAVGTTPGPPAPGTRKTRGLPFRPEALICFSWGLGHREEPTDIGRLCLGAATAPASNSLLQAQGVAGWDDRDTPGSRTATHSCSSEDDIVLVTNTQNGGLHAAAALRSLDRRGFTLDWHASDGFEREVAYVAIASATPRRRPWARSR